MRLFAERGYRQTTVSDIQSACGLSQGSGALYKHFRSKEEVFLAGVEREVVHLEGVRLAFRLMPEPADFIAELELLGRFVLMELGAERDLLRILLKEGEAFPGIMSDARDRLIAPAFSLFADWLRTHVDAGNVQVRDLEGVATVALGAIFQYRAMEALVGEAPGRLDEERYLQSWVEMVGSMTREANV